VSYSNIAAALEAGIITLQLLGNPSMPRELYIQEVIEQLLDVVKYTLQHNVLVFLDAKLRKKWQPEGIVGHAPSKFLIHVFEFEGPPVAIACLVSAGIRHPSSMCPGLVIEPVVPRSGHGECHQLARVPFPSLSTIKHIEA
jgi:hypothetical protein